MPVMMSSNCFSPSPPLSPHPHWQLAGGDGPCIPLPPLPRRLPPAPPQHPGENTDTKKVQRRIDAFFSAISIGYFATPHLKITNTNPSKQNL